MEGEVADILEEAPLLDADRPYSRWKFWRWRIWGRIRRWMSEHRTTTAFLGFGLLCGFLGIGLYRCC